MTNLKNKIITTVATGAILLNAFAPLALADTTIEISGNGSSSDNAAKVSAESNTTVVQNNNANVTNQVDADATTGNNDANDNTGGDVVISTGDAKTSVGASTVVNANHADADQCNCNSNADVLISGNGYGTDNDVKLETSNDVKVFQDNTAKISNDIEANAKTGNNDANRNTGGSVLVLTGDAESKVDVKNKANANIAKVGGHGNGSKMDIRVIGNGSESDNDIRLETQQSITLVQNNDAYVSNDISVDAKTGGNDANDNTGGDVVIDTGNAKASVEVDNMVNFNAADVDCGCLTDVLAKISGNGSDSDNDLKAEIEKKLSVFQDSASDLYNDVSADAKTGNNDAKRNTGPAHKIDPVEILTGDSTSWTDVNNSGNVNIFGPGVNWHLPKGVNLDFHFDLSALLRLIHMG